MSATSDYFALLPKPPPATPLLTRDEAATLLRDRGFITAAEDFTADRAGPAWLVWRGERRFDWWTVWHWGSEHRGVPWIAQGDAEQVVTARK